jgi:hypothetical protein
LRTGRDFLLPATALALLALLSCRVESDATAQDGPVINRTSLHYLLSPVTAARDGIIEAEAKLRDAPPDVEAATRSLEDARRSLADLEGFYIPVTEARENVYNAYRYHLSGNPDKRDGELDLARQGLLQASGRAGARFDPYIEDLANRIESVQLHARDGVSIDDELKSLCDTFQVHLLKAPLVLDEISHVEPETSITNHPKEVDDVNQK